MKKRISLLLLISSMSALTEEIRVKKMYPDRDLERSFVLTTSIPDKVVLDCQSFVQGLRIGEQDGSVFFLLDPFECEAMQDRVKNSLKRRQNHCIDVELDIRSDYTCPRN